MTQVLSTQIHFYFMRRLVPSILSTISKRSSVESFDDGQSFNKLTMKDVIARADAIHRQADQSAGRTSHRGAKQSPLTMW